MPCARHRLRIGLVGVGVVVPSVAAAGNGGHPRTPVEWPGDVPCMTVVDRSQSATLHFPYTILYEDTELTPDELPSSRRHQFVAFCRNHSPQEPLPTWLSWADVGVWNDWLMNLGADPLVLGDEDVLETSSMDKDCFVRITPDDARRPITFAEASKGVDWDTTGLAAGAYIVQGYTWEPGTNIWSQRPGVVHVVDGPDLTAVGPAAALTNQEDFVFFGDELVLQGCARAMPGSTLTASWSLTDFGLDWQPFAADVPLAGDAIALPFSPPPEALEQTIALRVDVTDPLQRSFSAYPLRLVVVLPAGAGSTSGCGDTCGGSSGTTSSGGEIAPTTGITGTASSSSTGGDATSTTAPVDGAGPTGCGCVTGERAPAWGLATLLGLAVRRRRRGSSVHGWD